MTGKIFWYLCFASLTVVIISWSLSLISFLLLLLFVLSYWFSWERIKHLCDLRRRYVLLYSSYLQQSSNFDFSELRQIEKVLDSKVIILWRLPLIPVTSYYSYNFVHFVFSYKDNCGNFHQVAGSCKGWVC